MICCKKNHKNYRK